MGGINFLSELLPIVIYILLIVVLIIGIIIGIKFIITMTKVEKVVDDVNEKVQSLNSFFSVIDFTTDKIARFSDSIVSVITSGLIKIFNIFKNKKKEENEDE